MYTCNRKSTSLCSSQAKLIHVTAVTQYTSEHTSNHTLAVPEQKEYAVKSSLSTIVDNHMKDSVTINLFTSNTIIYRE